MGNELAPLLAGTPLGSDNGPGFGWDDVDVFKLGAQYALGDRFVLRGGFSHVDQPIPAAFDGGEVDLSMNQDILGIGWSLSF